MAITKPRGAWRYEDLFDLPDDRRYEIIDGELYEMIAPEWDHAQAIANLMLLLGPLVRQLGGEVVTAPVDVFFIDADPVQPDIVVLLPERLSLISRRGVEGPPNLLIEILSPSNPEHDRRTKRVLYARGGVPEYWMLSPEAAVLEVLVLDGDLYRTHVHAAGDEIVTSPLLPGLSFPASAAFRSARRRAEELDPA